MLFCQISQILIPCLHKLWIFFLGNLVICCRVMTVSAVACSQQVMGMGNTVSSLHSQRAPKQLCWCLFHLLTFFVPLHNFFSLRLSYFCYSDEQLVAWRAVWAALSFAFLGNTVGKMDTAYLCLFFFFFYFTLSTCSSSSCIRIFFLKTEGENTTFFLLP